MKAFVPSGPDGFIELHRRAPVLEALLAGPAERADLEETLGVSRATSHRLTRWLGDRGLIERVEGEFRLTALGRTVAATIGEFQVRASAAFLLAPVLEATRDAVLPLPFDAFADATVTTSDGGDPHAPMTRYVSLVRETETLRGFDTWAIAPTYMGEIQERIVEGMETELVDPVPVVEDVMDSYPERCVQVCASGNLAIRLHDALPFGLAIFDGRVGIAVRDPGTDTLAALVDTDDPVAREWAEAIYETYRDESVPLETFTRKGLRTAMAAR